MNLFVRSRILLGILASKLVNYYKDMVLLILDVISTHFPDLFDLVVNITQGDRDPKKPRLSIADICNDTPMQGTDDAPAKETDDTPMQGTDDTSKRDPDDTPMGNSDDTSRQDRDKTPTQNSYDEDKQILEDEKNIKQIFDNMMEILENDEDEEEEEETSSELDKPINKYSWTHNRAKDEVNDMRDSFLRKIESMNAAVEIRDETAESMSKLKAWGKLPEGPEKDKLREELDELILSKDGKIEHMEFITKQSGEEFKEHKRKAEILLDREKSNVEEVNKAIMEVLGIDNKEDLYKAMAEQQIADNPDIKKKPEELAKELSAAASGEPDQNTVPQTSSPETPTYTGKGKKRVYDYDSPVDKSSSSKRNSSNESLEFVSYKSPVFDLFNFNLPDCNIADDNLSNYDLDYEIFNEFPFCFVCISICIFLFRPFRFIRTKLLYIIATVVLLVFVLLFLILIFI